MHVHFHVKYSLFLSDFNERVGLSGRFSKNTQIPNFMNICQLGTELFHADGWTERQTNVRTDRQT